MRLKATVSAHVLITEPSPQGGLHLLLGKLAYRDHRWQKWCFPGGYVDQDEQLEISLSREVQEETGIRLLSWQRRDVYPTLQAKEPHISFLFQSTQWEGKPECCCKEFTEILWVDEQTFRHFSRDNRLAYAIMKEQVACLGWHI